jgi:hypothetical protein
MRATKDGKSIDDPPSNSLVFIKQGGQWKIVSTTSRHAEDDNMSRKAAVSAGDEQ